MVAWRAWWSTLWLAMPSSRTGLLTPNPCRLEAHKIACVHDVRDAWLARRESAFGAWLGVGWRLPRGDWQ